MYTLETSIIVNGNKNLQSLDDFYQFDKTLSSEEIWHNFGVYCKTAISLNKMRDLKKEMWNSSAQEYKLNLYFNTEAEAQQAQADLKDQGFWPGGTNPNVNGDDITPSETIYAVNPMQVAGAVAMTADWFDNPVVDVNQ